MMIAVPENTALEVGRPTRSNPSSTWTSLPKRIGQKLASKENPQLTKRSMRKS